LEERWPGLPERVLRYVLDDDSPAVLAELAGNDGCGIVLEPFADAIARLAVGSSKLAREAAEPLVRKAPGLIVPLVEAKASDGTPDQRLHAAKLLWTLDGERRREYLEARLAVKNNRRVADGVRELLAVHVAPAFAERFTVPPLPPVEVNARLGAETLAAWRAVFAEINKGLARLAKSPQPWHANYNLKPVRPQTIDKAFALLQRPLPASIDVAPEQFSYGSWLPESKALATFWARPELSMVHLLRFCLLAGLFNNRHDPMAPMIPGMFKQCLENFRETHPGTGMRELAAGLNAVGLDPEMPGRAQLSRYNENPFPWPAEDVWPYWAEHLDLLGEYFQPVSDDWRASYWRSNALEVLAFFPHPPARFLAPLWELALGTTKTHRLSAQKSLERAPDRCARITAALGSGHAEIRAIAADWLRRLREPSALEPLQAALRKEKNDAAKTAIMAALEQLGVPVDQFLDRPALRAEAEKGLAKGVLAALSSFPFETLPAVHWADNGARVEPEIVHWWLAQHGKLKNPEPGPLLRRYCAALRAGERETLGQFVLEAWIACDTAAISSDEAERAARQHAQMMVNHMQWVAQHGQQHPHGPAAAPVAARSLEEYYAAALPGFLRQPKGSAIEAKGVLAVAAACAGASAAPVVQRYLNQWYGTRTAQCRALLQMLAWVDHPAATQVLLATGSRFRTKGIQDEANKQAQALAERKGWTLEELSDRTVPTAGLDENGVLELDFG
ncbi:MAG: hypothetical protein M3463_23015, partial [Verrucomicrobiota bacterium]|nr:hypothetical protein [Verrucomicrobiota bacterium]